LITKPAFECLTTDDRPGSKIGFLPVTVGRSQNTYRVTSPSCDEEHLRSKEALLQDLKSFLKQVTLGPQRTSGIAVASPDAFNYELFGPGNSFEPSCRHTCRGYVAKASGQMKGGLPVPSISDVFNESLGHRAELYA
jgi:hypothetical protein